MAKSQTDAVARGVTSTIERGSGNVFLDLGFPDHEEMRLKSDLAMELRNLYEASGLSQTEFARKVGLDRSKVSRLMSAHLDHFSVEKLLKLILAMNQNIEVRIAPNRIPSMPPAFKVMSKNNATRVGRAAKALV